MVFLKIIIKCYRENATVIISLLDIFSGRFLGTSILCLLSVEKSGYSSLHFKATTPRPLPPPLCRMLALAISETSSLVHRISLVASLAWQVGASRSPSISKEYGFEEIVANGFSGGKMEL